MTVQQNSFRHITLWFEVKFYNYFTRMITILRQRVACNIWVATVKAKVIAWPCIKIVSGPKLCYLKSDFTTTFDKLLPCVQYLFREHYPVPTGSCFPLLCQELPTHFPCIFLCYVRNSLLTFLVFSFVISETPYYLSLYFPFLCQKLPTHFPCIFLFH